MIFRTLKDAVAHYAKTRRKAVSPTDIVFESERGTVAVRTTRNSVMLLRVTLTDGTVFKFPTIWDAKAGECDALVAEALAHIYGGDVTVVI